MAYQGIEIEEERRLIRQAQGGNQIAMARLVKLNEGIIYRYAKNSVRSRIRIEDLLQEGRLGVVQAVRRFDLTRSTRLSTYAIQWIRAYLYRHILDFRGPMAIGKQRDERRAIFQAGKITAERLAEGRGTSPEDLAEILGISVGLAVDVMARLADIDVSFNAPIDDAKRYFRERAGTESSIEDRLCDESHFRWQLANLKRWLSRLDPRDRVIIEEHLLNGVTLSEIGQKFDISRERVRQLEFSTMVQIKRLGRVANWTL